MKTPMLRVLLATSTIPCVTPAAQCSDILYSGAVWAGDLTVTWRQASDVAVFQEHDVLAVGQEREDIRGDPCSIIRNAHTQRRALLGRDELRLGPST